MYKGTFLFLLIVGTSSSFAQHGAVKTGKNPFHGAYHDSLQAMSFSQVPAFDT